MCLLWSVRKGEYIHPRQGESNPNAGFLNKPEYHSSKISHRIGKTLPICDSQLRLCPMNEQCARLAEIAKLISVSKPSARVGFRRGSGIGNPAMRDIGETRIVK